MCRHGGDKTLQLMQLMHLVLGLGQTEPESEEPTNPTAVSWSESVASFCSLSSILEVVKSSASCSSTLQDPSGYAATPLPHGNLRPKYREVNFQISKVNLLAFHSHRPQASQEQFVIRLYDTKKKKMSLRPETDPSSSQVAFPSHSKHTFF